MKLIRLLYLSKHESKFTWHQQQPGQWHNFTIVDWLSKMNVVCAFCFSIANVSRFSALRDLVSTY